MLTPQELTHALSVILAETVIEKENVQRQLAQAQDENNTLAQAFAEVIRDRDALMAERNGLLLDQTARELVGPDGA